MDCSVGDLWQWTRVFQTYLILIIQAKNIPPRITHALEATKRKDITYRTEAEARDKGLGSRYKAGEEAYLHMHTLERRLVRLFDFHQP